VFAVFARRWDDELREDWFEGAALFVDGALAYLGAVPRRAA